MEDKQRGLRCWLAVQCLCVGGLYTISSREEHRFAQCHLRPCLVFFAELGGKEFLASSKSGGGDRSVIVLLWRRAHLGVAVIHGRDQDVPRPHDPLLRRLRHAAHAHSPAGRGRDARARRGSDAQTLVAGVVFSAPLPVHAGLRELKLQCSAPMGGFPRVRCRLLMPSLSQPGICQDVGWRHLRENG